MKNKKRILAIAALVLAAALFVGIYIATRPETTQGAKTYTVTVVHGDGSTKDFTYHTDKEYLGDALVAEGLITGYESAYGLTVEAVDGETASWDEGKAYWALYVGEEYAMTGVSATPVNDGDSFKWVYTVSDEG